MQCCWLPHIPARTTNRPATSYLSVRTDFSRKDSRRTVKIVKFLLLDNSLRVRTTATASVLKRRHRIKKANWYLVHGAFVIKGERPSRGSIGCSTKTVTQHCYIAAPLPTRMTSLINVFRRVQIANELLGTNFVER